MITAELLSMLWCPACQQGPLQATSYPPTSEGELRCETCCSVFPVRYGFPTLIPTDALSGPEWELWRRHLQRFEARRAKVSNGRGTVTRFRERQGVQPAFAEFAEIRSGTLLDLGCGPGKFRRLFDPKRVTYVGLDPLTLPEVGDFPFVQGVAEYLPFRSHTFTDIVILAALDHFKDLDRFQREATRVLAPGGRLHVLQSVHEVRGPRTALRVMAHLMKDSWDDRQTSKFGRDVPKHLSEFTESSLVERLSDRFEPIRSLTYSRSWYSPLKLFMTFGRREDTSMKASA